MKMKRKRAARPPAAVAKPEPEPAKRNLSGSYAAGLWNDAHAALVGKIAAALPEIEELMVDLTALLLGDPAMPGRQIFRGLATDEGRVRALKALLERASVNAGKGPEFDEVIDAYAAARKRRNAYVMGLWYTHRNGRTFLAEPTTDHAYSFVVAREVKTEELQADLAAVTALTEKLLRIVHPGVTMRGPGRARPPEDAPRQAPPQAEARTAVPRKPRRRRVAKAVA